MGFFSNIVRAVTRPVEQVVKKVGDFAGDVVKGVGREIGNLGNSIDDAVRDIIPGGWTTVVEAGIALTPAGALGSAAFGAASGGTGGFRRKFDLSGAIMGGLQGYGVGSLTQSLASAGAPAQPSGYETGADYSLSSASDLSKTPPATTSTTTDFGSGANYDIASATPPPSPPPSPVGLERVSLSPVNPNAPTYYSPDYVGGLNAPTPSPAGTISTISPDGLGQMNFPSGGEKLTLKAPVGANYVTPGPSALETLGSGMADKASQVGQGVKNLTGFGPDGMSGIIPAAKNVNAGMSYTAYSGLGSIALQEMAKKNQEDYDKGQITNTEYLENQRMIDQSVAESNEAVQKYKYEPDSQFTIEQPTFYGKKQKTLYDELELPQTNFAYGGTVENDRNSDEVNMNGLASGFNFNSKNQLPMYAVGGVAEGLGSYASGGSPRFLSGGGDGMSDSIRAKIDGHQEARLADGEFVIPADVVSHLGNGSSKAGAKQLHAMMNRIRKARTGNPKQGKQINPLKFMPA